MRTPGWSLATWLLLAPALLAQQQPAGTGGLPTPPAAPNPAQTDLDKLLQQWEQRMKSIQALEAVISRTEKDALTGVETVYEGWARFLRAGYRADLYLQKKNSNPPVYERFLCTGAALYEFRPKDKLIRIHQLPQRGPGQPAVEDNFLGFLFGMDAREAKRRYNLALKGQDQHYYYVSVRPLFQADAAEFTEARLALYKPTMLPAQMVFIPPNGNELTWNIARINPAAQLGPLQFQKPQLPAADWKYVEVPPPAPPGPPANFGAPGNPGAPAGPPPSKVRPSGG